MFKKILLLLAVVAGITGCGHVTGGVAPSNIPLAPGSYTEIGAVRGKTCVYHLLGIIPLTGGNETKDALDEALKENAGTYALINVTADSYAQNFILLSRMCTQVDGIAVKLKP